MPIKKFMNVVLILTTLVSCGMAQKQSVEIFATIKTDSLFDNNNQLTPAGNVLVEKIAAKMNSDSSSCLHIKQSCNHESDTVCYEKLKTLVNAFVIRVPAEHISVSVIEPVHLNCEDCFEFNFTKCPKTSSGNGSHITIIIEETDTLNNPPVINKAEYKDTLGIKILKALSENRKMARICKDTVMVFNNPYHVVYFIDTIEFHGINEHHFGEDFCIITRKKDFQMHNKKNVFYVSYFRHGNFSADVSLMSRNEKKITEINCELKNDGAGNWNVYRFKLKNKKAKMRK